MRPLTLTTPKPMLRVLGKPILVHIIEALPREVDEIIFVVGYKQEAIREYFKDSFAGRAIKYVVQNEQKGTGHALELCKDLIRPGERFLFMIGDDLHSRNAIANMLKHDLAMLAHEHSDPRRFGVVEVNEKGEVVSFIEKPEHPKSNLVSPAVFVLDDRIFNYPKKLHAAGEYFAVDQISQMMRDHKFIVERSDFWHPIGYPHDIDAAEQLLAEKSEPLATSVVILCGGKGVRLSATEPDLPKALVKVAGKPILQHQLDMLKGQGVTDITLALGYKAELITEWLKLHGYDEVRCAIEKQLLGTGGAVKHSAKAITSPFIVMNGDVLADFNLRGLLRHSDGDKRVITGFEVDDVDGLGVIECDENKKVCSFKEKMAQERKGIINAGLYVMYPQDLASMPESFSLEHDLFPKLAQRGDLVLHHHRGAYWFDCGTPERLKAVRDYFEKGGK